MRLIRLSELGGLPVGSVTLNDDGQKVRNRTVTFHRWTAKTALEVGQVRQGEESGMSPLQLQHDILCKLVKTWCGVDFSTLSEEKRSQVLDASTHADVAVAWILLRMSALGNLFPVRITCSKCYGKVSASDPVAPFTFEFDLGSLEVMSCGWRQLPSGEWEEDVDETPDFGWAPLVDGIEFSVRVPLPGGPTRLTAMKVRLGSPRWKAMRDLRSLQSVTGLEPATVRSIIREVDGMESVQLATMPLMTFAESLTFRDMNLIGAACENLKFPGPSLVIQERCPNPACGAPVHHAIDSRYGGDFFSVRGSSQSIARLR